MLGAATVRELCYLLVLLCAYAAAAQDLRTVPSPDGRIVFRAFVTPQGPGLIERMAYQVLYNGKILVETSFLGFEIRDQTLLGEKVGLTASETLGGSRYNSLTAEYLQNGSLGRRINLEIRVYDDGVAFRYVIPKSTPLAEILIENEDTEFRFAADAVAYLSLLSGFEGRPAHQSQTALSTIPSDAVIAIPLLLEQPNVGWIEIAEVARRGYPELYLNHQEGTTLISSLPPLSQDPHLAVDAVTPLTSPWRVLLISKSRESVVNSRLLDELKRNADQSVATTAAKTLPVRETADRLRKSRACVRAIRWFVQNQRSQTGQWRH
jgi:alpha-glucosidase